MAETIDLDDVSGLDLISAFTGLASVDPRRKELIAKLPALNEDDLTSLDHKDSCCPICFTPFLAVLASEEMALAMDSPALSIEDLGVTRLVETCGHLFCRKDITTWIQQHDTCPTCRQPFISAPAPPADMVIPQNNGRGPDMIYDNVMRGVLPPELSSDEGREGQERLMRLMSFLRQIPMSRESADGATEQLNEESDPRVGEGHRNDDRDDFIGMYS